MDIDDITETLEAELSPAGIVEYAPYDGEDGEDVPCWYVEMGEHEVYFDRTGDDSWTVRLETTSVPDLDVEIVTSDAGSLDSAIAEYQTFLDGRDDLADQLDDDVSVLD